MLYLRSADWLDAGDLAHLRAASLVELDLLREPDVAGFIVGAARDLWALFRAGRIAAWVACDAERVVASSCAIFTTGCPIPTDRVTPNCAAYVMPAYRKRGIASELVREVVAGAQAGGARKTFLRPSKDAKSLYARLGFVETELMTFAGVRRDREPSGPALAASASR